MTRGARVIMLAMLAAILAMGVAQAAAPGVTENDMTAAHCIGVEEANQAAIAARDEAARTESQARLRRFQQYLTGRGFVPGGPMAPGVADAEAMRQTGRADAQECAREHRTCSRVCSGNAVCMNNCTAAASICVRVLRCALPDVLPF